MKRLINIIISICALFICQLSYAQTHYLNYDGWYFAGISYPISIYGVRDTKTSLDVPSSVIDPGYVNSWTGVGKLSEKIFSKNGGYWSRISSAKSASIPSSITTMGESVFLNNTVIETVKVYASISIPASTFEGCTALSSVYWSSASSVGNSAFKGCTSLTSMSFLPSNVKTYGSNAFYNSGLKSFSFGENTTSIGSSAFENVTKPEFLSLPNSLTTISSRAFAGCTGLSLISFGNGKIALGSNAFSGCSNLKYIIIGNGMTSIGASAFAGCTNIKEIYINCSTPPTCTVGAFPAEVKQNAILYVPTGSFADYWSSPEWEDFRIVEKSFEPITSINIDENFEMFKDTRVRLPYSINPETASIPNLKFSSSNTSIAEVSSDGYVSGKRAGTTTITISSQDGSNIQKSCKVSVKEPGITEFELNTKTLILCVNEQANLSVSIKPDNTNKSVTWSSCNNEIAVVKERDGIAIVLARAVGETDIIVKSNEYPEVTDTCHVSVVEEKMLDGDVNRDGEIDASDIAYIVDYLLGIGHSGFDSNAADMNGDGKVDATDISRIIRLILSE